MENLNTVTFVTSFIKIYNNDLPNKSLYWRVQQFYDLAATGINIILYISDCYYEIFKDTLTLYTNIKIIKINDLQHFIIYKLYEQYKDVITLPSYRNTEKDTIEYMLLMNAKIEFINDAIQLNYFNNEYFAWIDFSITYIFKNKNKTLDYLKIISTYNYTDSFLKIAGCNNKINKNNHYDITERINWRFCGGFFIGDIKSLNIFYTKYVENIHIFFSLYKKLVWEVNYWAWLEANDIIKPIWFLADHDDTIIHIL